MTLRALSVLMFYDAIHVRDECQEILIQRLGWGLGIPVVYCSGDYDAP